MNHWLFDLDFTLYSKFDINDKTKQQYYNSFSKKPLLNNLIKTLDGKKYIFSNANYEHVNEVLSKMKLKTLFKKIASSDQFDGNLKPSSKSFEYVIKKFQLDKKTDKVYFFEDSIENLRMAKKFNWITILINPNVNKYKNYKNIDFVFPNIETAIFHFMKK